MRRCRGTPAQPSSMTPAGIPGRTAACRMQWRPSCASVGASAVPHPPSLTEGHLRRVVGGALQRHPWHSPQHPTGRRALACRCLPDPLQRRPSCGLRSNALAALPVPQPSCSVPQEAGWVGRCRGIAGTAHSITPAGIPAAPLLPPAGVMLWAVPGVPLQCPTHPASLSDTQEGWVGGALQRHPLHSLQHHTGRRARMPLPAGPPAGRRCSNGGPAGSGGWGGQECLPV